MHMNKRVNSPAKCKEKAQNKSSWELIVWEVYFIWEKTKESYFIIAIFMVGWVNAPTWRLASACK